MGTTSRLVSALLGMLRPSTAAPPRGPRPDPVPPTPSPAGARTIEIDPPRRLTLSYAPERDKAPDGGEIVWTWVPFEERDGRGKDRPVLIISRADARSAYAVRLTSKSHEGDRQYLALGTGEWDPQGRPSWVDIEQLYLVYDVGMRREAAALDRKRFNAIASALAARHGWRRE
ncbi:type II toxin-antitoxin system PemK/MazF family toxin [Microbacterium sp. BH-3-3-3]|uniref:type II toxin-antitoxin system PemK/MazF family toxin n=1 Tax=Microbacterium sp. BH-3-3-3 TaxID=1906742 RepID=UPI0009F6B2AC|nr:type II toxin-antitoxin system PemK/MazF family toxin [Microbacterium sp. BH-3-3-3]